MLTTIHILLTYKCPLRCDHCFVFGGPKSEGHLSLSAVNLILDQAVGLKTVEWIIFEGGEPFLYFPLLINCIHKAKKRGFKVGIITNGFFSRTDATAERYLRPLLHLKIDKLSVSNDLYHYKNQETNPAIRTLLAARKLGLPVIQVSVLPPGKPCLEVNPAIEDKDIHFSRLLISGRAASNYSNKPNIAGNVKFQNCPKSQLTDIEKISIDVSGFLQICPGLAIGNVFKTTLREIVEMYNPQKHRFCGPLNTGGPDLLAQEFAFSSSDDYTDGCHKCFTIRRSLQQEYPEFLAPRQVYEAL